MIHLVARRPVFAAVIVLAAVSVASVPKMPPPPPAPVPPAVVTFSADPAPTAADSERAASVPEASQSYSCVFGKNTAPTNLCKADLDSIAEYLFHNPTATVDLSGSMDHVLSVRSYFVSGESKFGIASGRVHVHINSTDSDNTVAITQVP